MTILFFLWGFAYGLLDALNPHFQASLNITASRASGKSIGIWGIRSDPLTYVPGLSAAYFGAYFLCPLTFSGYVLRRWCVFDFNWIQALLEIESIAKVFVLGVSE